MQTTPDPTEQLISRIHELRLTPDDLANRPYRLTAGRVAYIFLGLVMALVPLVFAYEVIYGTLSIGAALAISVFWIFLSWGGILNTREAVCEHIVGRWCAAQGLGPLDWLARRHTLVDQMPPRVRWASQHLPQGHRV